MEPPNRAFAAANKQEPCVLRARTAMEGEVRDAHDDLGEWLGTSRKAPSGNLSGDWQSQGNPRVFRLSNEKRH